MLIYKGFLFGLTLQLAIGPVFFAVLNRALQQGLIAALAMTWGVTLADAIYIAISFTGVSSLLSVPLVKQIASLLTALVLIIFGLSYFRPSPAITSKSVSSPQLNSHLGSFMLGFKITLASPLTIVFWAGTFGALISTSSLQTMEVLPYAVGCILSTLVFLSVTSILSHRISAWLKPQFLLYLNYLVGLFLIGFACKIAFGS